MIRSLTVALSIVARLAGEQLPAAESPPPPEQITVDSAVAEALSQNIGLLAERTGVPAAEARVLTARLRPNPILSLSADHLDLAGTGFSELNGAGPAEVSLRSDFLWEWRGKRSSRIQVAQDERAVVGAELLDRVRTLAFDVQSAFVDLLLAQETARIARENHVGMMRIRDVNAARVRTGDLSEVELLRTNVAVLQLENAVRRAHLEVRTMRTQLQVLLGRTTPSDRVEAAGDFRRVGVAMDPGELERVAFKARPDLQAALADESRATADLSLQMALKHGDVTLGTEIRRQQGINGKGTSLGFFFGAPLPLFDRNQGEIARAQVDVRRTSLRVQALRAAIAGEVRTAGDERSTAQSLVERIEADMLDQARQVRDATEYAYQRGEASFVELLDAERAFNETMQGYLAARAEFARSLYRIDFVCGREIAP